MNSDFDQAVMAAWAVKNLPARLDTGATAKILGFGENDIQILMAARKLIPLGDPAPNAPKWFAAMEMIRLAADDWLSKATKEVSKYWAAQTRPTRYSARMSAHWSLSIHHYHARKSFTGIFT